VQFSNDLACLLLLLSALWKKRDSGIAKEVNPRLEFMEFVFEEFCYITETQWEENH